MILQLEVYTLRKPRLMVLAGGFKLDLINSPSQVAGRPLCRDDCGRAALSRRCLNIGYHQNEVLRSLTLERWSTWDLMLLEAFSGVGRVAAAFGEQGHRVQGS